MGAGLPLPIRNYMHALKSLKPRFLKTFEDVLYFLKRTLKVFIYDGTKLLELQCNEKRIKIA